MPQKRSEKIILTGGHAATPGIAVVEEIVKRRGGIEIYWVGSKYAIPGKRVTTVEYKLLPKLGVKFYAIAMGKIQTKFTRFTIPLLFNIPVSFIQAFFILLSVRPDAILSFGGFSSFPVMFWGFFFRVPTVLHEQTVAAGRASIASGAFATKIAVARAESGTYFPKNKLIVTGNPLMSQILKVKAKDRLGNPPVIFVIGGSRGSQFINEEIEKILPGLIINYKVIHVTGEANYDTRLMRESPTYKVLSFIDPREMANYYREADIVISRAGANSVAEIMYVKRPAILIPLPRTFASEQVKNAEFAEEFGVAKMMLENEVNPKSLMAEIDRIRSSWGKIMDSIRKKESPDANSSKKLVDVLEEFLL